MAIGDIIDCKHCGSQFAKTARGQLMCPTCAAATRGLKAREKSESKKDTTPVKNRYSLSVKDYSLSEMERAARANGMTYRLTDAGMDRLGKMLGITIREEGD